MARILVACEYSGRVRDAFRALGHDAWSCDLLPADDDSPYHIQGGCFDALAGFFPVEFTMGCDPDGDGWCAKRDIDPAECDCIGPTEEDVEYKETEFGLLGRREGWSGWDLLIAHPPCTYLTCSAEWAYKERHEINKKLSPDKLYGAERRAARDEAAEFFMRLANADVPRIAIENPVGVMSTRYRKADQVIQPYEYGEDASKSTCLWLKGLPPLVPTQRFHGRMVEWPRGSGKMVERFSNQTDSGQSNLTPSSDRWKIRSYTYQGWADAMAEQWGALL